MQHLCCKVVIYVVWSLSYRARVDVGLSVGINVTASVPPNKVRVVIVLTKNVVEIIGLVL